VSEFGSAALKRRSSAFAGERFEPASAAVMEPRMDFARSAGPTLSATAMIMTGENAWSARNRRAAVPGDRQLHRRAAGQAHPQALILDRETPGLTVGGRQSATGDKALVD
jgi:hypothetical protein